LEVQLLVMFMYRSSPVYQQDEKLQPQAFPCEWKDQSVQQDAEI
jgi:hypothetical protein